MKSVSRAIAYPGLPIVFAEGYRIVDGRRLSRHASVGAALTDEREEVRTETEVTLSHDDVFNVDGKPVEGARGEGMRTIIEKMKEKGWRSEGLRIESVNHGILSGSSDSGAAALTAALDDFFDLKLPKKELLKLALYGSETAYRSLCGGLTENRIQGGECSATQLASARELSRIAVYAVSFPGKRYSADELHEAVVGHHNYALREKRAELQIRKLKDALSDGNLLSVLSVMEDDAQTVHRMFSVVGKRVITAPMRKLCDAVEGWRENGLEAYWNVAGGNQVYVFCLTEQKRETASVIAEGGWDALRLTFAEEARAL